MSACYGKANAAAILLSQCADRATIEWKWARIVGSLEAVLRRVGVVRRRGGSSPAVAAAVGWFVQVGVGIAAGQKKGPFAWMAHALMGRKGSFPAQMPTRNRFSLARGDAVVLGQRVARAVIGSALW